MGHESLLLTPSAVMTEASPPEPNQLRALLARRNWRLAFPRRLEQDYRQRLLAAWRSQARWALGIGSVMYGAYGVIDYRVFHDFLPALWTLRYGVVLPILVGCLLLLGRVRQERAFQATMFAMIVTAGIGVVGMNLVMQSHYYQGLILVILFGCVVLPLRFPWALAAVVILLLAHLLSIPAHWEDRLPVIVNVFDTATAAAFGLVAGYMLERYRRQDFLRTRLLELSSRVDGLTGVATRKAFDDCTAATWARIAESGRPAALLFVDVDHFKALNDRAGHQAGDACLRRIAEVLRAHTRKEEDCVGRYGGEEFTLLLPGVSEDETRRIAERIRQEVARLHLGESGDADTPAITVSIGAGWAAEPARITWEEAIRRADAAMYRAKEQGRDRVEFEAL